MCRFIETIRIENGKVMSLPYHQARVDRTLSVMGHNNASISLAGHFEKTLGLMGLAPDNADCIQSGVIQNHSGTYKAKIIYDISGNILEHSILPYKMRNIKSLRPVICNDIDYGLKYADRGMLDELSSLAEGADEIIIVRDGLLTDTSFSNIALYDGKRWVTPRSPLLYGTMRQSLIDEGILTEADITVEGLRDFQKISLINAMMPLGKCCLSIHQVKGVR